MIAMDSQTGKEVANLPTVEGMDGVYIDSLESRIEIDSVHTFNSWEICDFLSGLRIHGNHLRGSARADKQPVVFFVKGPVAVALTAGRPRRHHFALLRIHNLNYARNGNENEQGLAGFVQQKFRRVGLHFDVAEVLVCFGVDNSDFPVILAGILASVSDVQDLSVWIVGDTVGSQIQLDRVQQVQSVAPEYPDHPVISTGHKQLVKRWNVGNALCFLKTWNALQPFPSLQINHFD